MYGNFDAIKRRKQLRKETTTARKDRVDSVKDRIHRSKKINVFPEVSNDTLEKVNERMALQLKQEHRRELLIYIIVFTISTIIVGYLIARYIYPAIF